MAAQAAITLTDASVTPVDRLFSPLGADANGVFRWRYLSDGTIAGYQWLTQSVRGPTPQSDAYKVTFKLVIPVLETVSTSGTSAGYTASPKVAYRSLANLEFVLPTRSSLQDRKDLRSMVYNLLQESVLTDAVWNLEPAW